MSNPIDLTISKIDVITSFEIVQVDVVLNTSADIRVLMKNSANGVLYGEHVKIQGDDYNNWLDDDQYIIDFVKNYILQKYNGTV